MGGAKNVHTRGVTPKLPTLNEVYMDEEGQLVRWGGGGGEHFCGKVSDKREKGGSPPDRS